MGCSLKKDAPKLGADHHSPTLIALNYNFVRGYILMIEIIANVPPVA